MTLILAIAAGLIREFGGAAEEQGKEETISEGIG